MVLAIGSGNADARTTFDPVVAPPTPLDPIVSLAVAMAEAPGSYAFFLGSGVSRDAGVPTGGEVYWQAVAELYRLEESSGETSSDEDLEHGFAKRAEQASATRAFWS